jgi:DNA invertase Pin-like site-specific DNA recombinase
LTSATPGQHLWPAARPPAEPLAAAGIPAEWAWADEKTGATADRDSMNQLLGDAWPGDTIVVHTLDRVGQGKADLRARPEQLRRSSE